MNDSEMRMLQGSIDERQTELHCVAELLTRTALQQAKIGKLAKVVVIVLGAFAATKAAADGLLGAGNKWSLAVYAFAGLATAAVGALEAAFKYESTAAELKVLAATGQATVRHIDTEWQRTIGMVADDQRVPNALNLLQLQDAKLTELQDKASKLGVVVNLQVHGLQDRGQYAA